jgi:uncharacterized protein (DUF1697 family)
MPGKSATSTHVALLYTIVLADGRRVVMTDLRAMAEKIGFASPQTVVATGNLIFAATSGTVAQIESRLEAAHKTTFGKPVDIIVRKAADWRQTLGANPYARESKSDPSHVVTRVMRKPVDDGMIAVLKPYTVAGEVLKVVNGDLWIYFRHGIGRSKLAAAMTPKRVGIGTSRNWNTMKAIGDLLDG